MPDAQELLAAGVRYESGGMPDRALEHYHAAASMPVADAALIAEALRRQSGVLRARCDWPAALAAAQRSAEAARTAGRADLEAEAINAEAAVHQSRGDFDEARPLYETMLRISDDARIRGIALQNLGSIAAHGGDLDLAERHFLKSYDYFVAAGYSRGEAITLNNRGRCLLDRGADGQAEPLLRSALDRAYEVGDLGLVALARLNLSEALLARGAADRAEELASAALGYFAATANRWRQVECLRLLGDIGMRSGQQQHARLCYEAGLRAADAIDAKVESAQLAERLARLGEAGD
jgi:tetratricopeptide (TPR) repeat protein